MTGINVFNQNAQEYKYHGKLIRFDKWSLYIKHASCLMFELVNNKVYLCD